MPGDSRTTVTQRALQQGPSGRQSQAGLRGLGQASPGLWGREGNGVGSGCVASGVFCVWPGCFGGGLGGLGLVGVADRAGLASC